MGAVPTTDFQCAGVVVALSDEVERYRREADHFQIRAAFGATQLVTPIDVELVDIEFRVAVGARRHQHIYASVPDYSEECGAWATSGMLIQAVDGG